MSRSAHWRSSLPAPHAEDWGLGLSHRRHKWAAFWSREGVVITASGHEIMLFLGVSWIIVEVTTGVGEHCEWIPQVVFDSIKQHFRSAQCITVGKSQVSWLLGGHRSPGLKIEIEINLIHPSFRSHDFNATSHCWTHKKRDIFLESSLCISEPIHWFNQFHPKTNLEQQLIQAEPAVRGDKTKTFPSNPTKQVRQRWKAVNQWIVMISLRRSITFKWIHTCRLAPKEAWIDSDSQQNNRWFVHSNTAKMCLSLHQ